MLLYIPERLTPGIIVLFTRVLYEGHEGHEVPLFLKRARKGRGPGQKDGTTVITSQAP